MEEIAHLWLDDCVKTDHTLLIEINLRLTNIFGFSQQQGETLQQKGHGASSLKQQKKSGRQLRLRHCLRFERQGLPDARAHPKHHHHPAAKVSLEVKTPPLAPTCWLARASSALRLSTYWSARTSPQGGEMLETYAPTTV